MPRNPVLDPGAFRPPCASLSDRSARCTRRRPAAGAN